MSTHRVRLKKTVPKRPNKAEADDRYIRPAQRLVQQKYREIIAQHLTKLLDALFADFTGLHFHIAWRSAAGDGWDAEALPSGCSVCCKLSGSPLRRGCQTCGRERLGATLKTNRGHSFTCSLGVRNFWMALRVRDETLGIAYLQALEDSATASGKSSFGAGSKRPRRPGAVVVGRAEFRRAARFLKLIVEHVQTASLSDLHVADLSSAGRAVEALEREQARLRATLHRQLPAASPIVRRSGGESHADQLVHALLEDIEMEYGKQLTLQGYARELGMNAAYLSTLFSKTVGVPFKAYLTDLRLQKAKELLSNPANTVSEVAFQVGYATEDRFRSAFKQATGLSPKQWRETLRAQRPNPV